MNFTMPSSKFMTMCTTAGEFGGGASDMVISAKDTGVVRIAVNGNPASVILVTKAADVHEAGEVAASSAMISNAAGIIDGDDVSVSVAGNTLAMSSVSRDQVVGVPALAADTTSPIRPPSGTWTGVESWPVLIAAVNRCLWAVPASDPRPVMTGLGMVGDHVVGGNGHVMALAKKPGDVVGQDFSDLVIAARSWALVTALNSCMTSPVSYLVEALGHGGNRLWIKSRDGGWVVSLAPVPGQYPDVRGFVFDSLDEHWHRDKRVALSSVSVGRRMLLSSARHVVKVSGGLSSARFTARRERLYLSSYHVGDDNGHIDVEEDVVWEPVSADMSDDGGAAELVLAGLCQVGFSAQYLSSSLASLTGEVVTLSWAHGDVLGHFPLQIRDVDGDNVAMVMPRRM